MKLKPVYLIVAGVLLIAILFFFGKTNGPEKVNTDEGHTNAAQKASSESKIDFKPFITEAKKHIDINKLKQIDTLEKQLSAATEINQKIELTKNLTQAWKNAGSKIITAEYAKQLAFLTQQPQDYALAGDLLVTAFETAADTNLSKQLVDEAFSTLQKAIELDTNNIDNKVNMAACLMEGRNQIMDGVPILLEIVKKSPNHLKANFILAKFAVVSGQYDKAINRLEKLISNNPTYTDAYLVLANAYASKGEIPKAKATLQKCQQHTTDTQIKSEVDKLIKQFN